MRRPNEIDVIENGISVHFIGGQNHLEGIRLKIMVRRAMFLMKFISLVTFIKGIYVISCVVVRSIVFISFLIIHLRWACIDVNKLAKNYPKLSAKIEWHRFFIDVI